MKKTTKADRSFAESESSSSRLPAEALKFGKQLGIDFKGLEPEAQEIWRQLEYLSNNDPLEYQRFISQQMQAAKEEEEEKKQAAAKKAGKGKSEVAEDKPKSEGGYFRPEACFCVKVPTFGGDGLKVRDMSESSLPELTLYVNMCSSKVIDEPTDQSGKKIEDVNLPVADGLQIPLVVGPLRRVDELGNAIDVVFHPIIATLCDAQRYFKVQIVDLALEWVKQEAKVQMDTKKWEDVDLTNVMKYKGGLGDSKDIPVLFHVSADGDTTQPLPGPAPSTTPSIFSNVVSNDQVPKKVKKIGTVTLSTDSLLSTMRQEHEPAITELNLTIPTPSDSTTATDKSQASGIQPAVAPTKKKFVIEEIGADKSVSLVEELEGNINGERMPASLMQEVTSVKISSQTNVSPQIIAANTTLNNNPGNNASSNKKKSVSFESLRGKLNDSSSVIEPAQTKARESTQPLKPPSKDTLDDLEAMLSRCDEEFSRSAVAEEADISGMAASASILADLAKAFSTTSNDIRLNSLLADTLAQAKKIAPSSSSGSSGSVVSKPLMSIPVANSLPAEEPTITIRISHPNIIKATCTAIDASSYDLVLEGIRNSVNGNDLILEVR
jgi:hypothetical protein